MSIYKATVTQGLRIGTFFTLVLCFIVSSARAEECLVLHTKGTISINSSNDRVAPGMKIQPADTLTFATPEAYFHALCEGAPYTFHKPLASEITPIRETEITKHARYTLRQLQGEKPIAIRGDEGIISSKDDLAKHFVIGYPYLLLGEHQLTLHTDVLPINDKNYLYIKIPDKISRLILPVKDDTLSLSADLLRQHTSTPLTSDDLKKSELWYHTENDSAQKITDVQLIVPEMPALEFQTLQLVQLLKDNGYNDLTKIQEEIKLYLSYNYGIVYDKALNTWLDTLMR